MICRRATYFTDLEMIKYYRKMWGWNSKSTKTKNYIKNWGRYTTLKKSLYFTLRCMTLLWEYQNLWSTLHRFTNSVPVLILPIFWKLFLRNGKILSKPLFWNKQTQHADSRWQQHSYFTSTSINFSIIYFQIGSVLQLNYYQ